MARGAGRKFRCRNFHSCKARTEQLSCPRVLAPSAIADRSRDSGAGPDWRWPATRQRRLSFMVRRKSYLIIGRLPTSALFASIQSKHDITHIPTRDLKRADVITRVSQLPQKSYTFVLFVGETQHIYPVDEALLGPISVEFLCKVGAGFDSIDVDYFTSRGTWVANAPKAVRIPTAEWCVSLILATVKGIGVADQHVRRGQWRTGLGLQSNIQGMSLGIVGLGAIGKV